MLELAHECLELVIALLGYPGEPLRGTWLLGDWRGLVPVPWYLKAIELENVTCLQVPCIVLMLLPTLHSKHLRVSHVSLTLG